MAQIHNLPYLKERRRTLRKQLTAAETALWTLLRRQKLGRKFRRQHSIENYIVDFYCPSERLIIELDGEIHRNLGQSNADFLRDQRLSSLGFQILRFENKLVFEQPETVLEIIKSRFIKNQLHSKKD